MKVNVLKAPRESRRSLYTDFLWYHVSQHLLKQYLRSMRNT